MVHLRFHILKKKLFEGSNQYQAMRVYDLCVYFMTDAPEGSTESGSGVAIFMGESETFPQFLKEIQN